MEYVTETFMGGTRRRANGHEATCFLSITISNLQALIPVFSERQRKVDVVSLLRREYATARTCDALMGA
jgi:hypothetical protein